VTSSDWYNLFAGLIGGIGFFIIGMQFMSGALQKYAGDGLKKVLEKMTSNRVTGAAVGTVVTAIIQSSTATTVMVVGFVNAGLMNLMQALSIVLGANVGTTLTAQLLAFDIAILALPAVGFGMCLKVFSKNEKTQYLGEMLLGFGMLFIGLEILKDSFVPLRNSEGFKELFVLFSSNPLLAVATGAILTMVVQSSTATIGITIALATTGLIDFYTACALVLGENIGTTLTANLAAINASRTARQAAFGHFLLNLFGVAYMLLILPYVIDLIGLFTPGDPDFINDDGSKPNIARHIANLHSAFNIINMLVFLPLLHYLAKACEFCIKPEKEQDKLVRLNDNIMSTPAIAVSQAQQEVIRMSGYAGEMIGLTRKYFVENDETDLKNVKVLEGKLDAFEKEISGFLMKLATKNVSQQSVSEINDMYHIIHNLEKIGDYSESIYNCIKKTKKKEIVFSEAAISELTQIYDVVTRFYEKTLDHYKKGKIGVYINTDDEDTIDSMRKKFKKNHIKRLNDGECTIDAGLIYVDILNHLEKIGDHTFNIAHVLMSDMPTPAIEK
jgi:phosphate:Na+ symporter